MSRAKIHSLRPGKCNLVSMETVEQVVSDLYQVPLYMVKVSNATFNRHRFLLIYLYMRCSGLTSNQIACYLGISKQRVLWLRKRAYHMSHNNNARFEPSFASKWLQATAMIKTMKKSKRSKK